ncbi:MAG: M1 family metallopeptidase [bacterium]
MKKLIVLLFLFTQLVITGLSQPPEIGDTLHAIHYAIHLGEINPGNQQISGHTEILCTSLVDNLDYIPLELKDLDIDSVKVGNLNLPFTHENEVVRIELASPLNTGDTLEVEVYYGGKPFHENWGGFHFSGDYAFNLGVGFISIPHNLGKSWFPCVDNFTDRATYDLYVRVADSLTAIGGGTLQDTVNHGDGTKTWHWRLDKPIPTYLASVAVGDYRLYSDEYEGINDTIPITVYARPSEIEKVEGSFVNLKSVMEWFEERFGAYPFDRIGYVGTAIGAMEHATNIAYPHSAINGNTSSESLMVHELAHMWLGDMVTCSTAEDMWLNEGWATFCALLYIKDLYDEQQFMDLLRHEQREVMRKVHIADGGYYALNNIPQEVTYGEHCLPGTFRFSVCLF